MEDFRTDRTNKQVKKWRTLEEVKSSYTYQTVYSQLKSQGIALFPLEKDEILSQIFPKSKIWKFANENGEARYLIDGADKVEHSVITDEPVTGKVADLRLVDYDYDYDGKKELVVLTFMNFQDVALCCNQKKILSVFKTEGEEKVLVYEQELEIYRGGWVTKGLKTLDLDRDGEDETLEIKVYGDGYTGAYATVVRWFIVEDKKFKEIWREDLEINMDMAGVVPEEEKENYKGSFELIYRKEKVYPKIKVTKIYNKKDGKNLSSSLEISTIYNWNPNNKRFEILE